MMPPHADRASQRSYATCDLRLATCDLRLATCDLRLATCDLRLATCDLRTNKAHASGEAWATHIRSGGRSEVELEAGHEAARLAGTQAGGAA
ncbi:MAG TPA: hypothetical protein ENN42_10365 [Thioalkalivibrio sp.]|nr:hypothetical protein [Thioalkalivibrio sp.]